MSLISWIHIDIVIGLQTAVLAYTAVFSPITRPIWIQLINNIILLLQLLFIQYLKTAPHIFRMFPIYLNFLTLVWLINTNIQTICYTRKLENSVNDSLITPCRFEWIYFVNITWVLILKSFKCFMSQSNGEVFNKNCQML